MAGRAAAPDAAEDEGKVTPDEAMHQAAKLDGAKGKQELPGDVEDAALAWFLDDDEPEFTRTLELNVGTDDDPKWIPWTIRALDADEIRRLNKASEGNRAGRRGQIGNERDPDMASRRIVAAATVNPDLLEVAKLKGVQIAHGDPLWAPMQVLQWRFRAKPGLIVQLANDVFGLSGYDDEDIRGVQAGKS
jgi:hypothetical protein